MKSGRKRNGKARESAVGKLFLLQEGAFYKTKKEVREKDEKKNENMA